MPSIPRIKESAIRRWTDDAYFHRGQNYFEQGAIYDQRRQGMTLKSKCSGTQSPFYRQEVWFDSKGIKSAECSCPVGAGGRCKHTVALLLMWVSDPDSFKEVEAIDATLEKRSKAELIALIKQILDQEPDLDYLLELPLSDEERKTLDIKTIRKQAQRAFGGSGYYDEWTNTREIERNLNPLFKLAEGYLAHNNANNAASIYETIIETILVNEDVALGDEEGELLGVVFDCAESLGECISKTTDSKKRKEILQVLFSAYEWDKIKMGGVGAADRVPEIFTSKTRPEEKTEIAKWTREIMPKGKDWSDGYHREVLGRLLLDLEADTLDDEAYLKICRETGRLNDLIERLLKLKRIKDAEESAKAAEDYPLLQTLDIFVKHKQADLAEKLVIERLEKIKDSRLIEWLSERLRERGDLAGSLKLEERLFWQRPNIEQYKKLCKPAKKLNQWNALRARIVAELEKKKDVGLLIDIYLHDKEVGLALAMLGRMPEQWMVHSLRIEVAKAAKTQYPQESIRLYTEAAVHIMDRRDRGNYSQAAQYLREVRDIYAQINETPLWNELIADIRERYKKLPALQSELNQLKL